MANESPWVRLLYLTVANSGTSGSPRLTRLATFDSAHRSDHEQVEHHIPMMLMATKMPMSEAMKILSLPGGARPAAPTWAPNDLGVDHPFICQPKPLVGPYLSMTCAAPPRPCYGMPCRRRP